MPKLFTLFGITFFYSSEHLSVHVDLRTGEGNVKLSVEPAELIENNGMQSKDLKFAETAVFRFFLGLFNHYQQCPFLLLKNNLMLSHRKIFSVSDGLLKFPLFRLKQRL